MAAAQIKHTKLYTDCRKAQAASWTFYNKYKSIEKNLKEQQFTNLKKIRKEQLEKVIDCNGKEVVLGAGRFGICRYMKFKVGTDTVGVAVKEYYQETCKDIAVREASLLQQFNHKCFPFFLGCMFEGLPVLVLELCNYFETQSTVMTVSDALNCKDNYYAIQDEKLWVSILESCCEGFIYMHEVHSILHNDIKSHNIVLAKRGCDVLPKIIDFNKSLPISECKCKHLSVEEQEKYKIFHRHIAPEVYMGLSPHSQASDVYSFGFMVGKIAKKLASKKLSEMSEMCVIRNSRYRITLPNLLKIMNTGNHQI